LTRITTRLEGLGERKTTEKKGKTEGRRFKETQRLEGGEIGEGLPKADFFC